VTRSFQRWLAALILLAVAVAAGAYVMLIQPGGTRHVDAEEARRLAVEAEDPVFAYGTLTSPLVRFVVTLQAQETRPASLRGYRREGRNIVPDPGGIVDGLVFEVTPTELRRLDLYERVGERYERIRVGLADGTAAWAYQALDARR
jgi:gamma-glutamylcyclotransferase (GGCT)/AIG2-like uncharacterized protein YtfP